MTGQLSTKASPPSRAASLKEQSTSTIQAAIRSGTGDASETLTRINAVLAIYFEPEMEPAARAAIREEFVRALEAFPAWAMHRACDAWVRTGTRRPAPADLVILASRELQPYTDELHRRTAAMAEHAQAEADRARNRVTAEAASRIMAEKGFTEERLNAVMRRPMARNMDEAIAPMVAKPHNAEMSEEHRAALERSRRANSLCNPGAA